MTKEFQAQLNEIQVGLVANKSKRNSFGNYNYRSAEDILEALKPHLKKTVCVLNLSDDVVLVADRIYVKATATLIYGEESISSSAFAREPIAKKGTDESQVTGASSSYARKYALCGLFAIDDGVDADLTNTHGKDENDTLQQIIAQINTFTTKEQMDWAWNTYACYQNDKTFREEWAKQKMLIQNGTIAQ